MKSKYLILLLSIGCFTTFTVNAQTYNNSNRGYNRSYNKVKIKKATPTKKVNVRTNRHNTYGSHHVNTHRNQHSSHRGSVKVIKRPNRNNIIRYKCNS